MITEQDGKSETFYTALYHFTGDLRRCVPVDTFHEENYIANVNNPFLKVKIILIALYSRSWLIGYFKSFCFAVSRFQFQSVTFCNRLTAFFAQPIFQDLPILSRCLKIRLLEQNLDNIHHKKIPSFGFRVVHTTDFEVFKNCRARGFQRFQSFERFTFARLGLLCRYNLHNLS